jgi:hypothetical protein
VHNVRDVTLGEDAHQMWTGSAPQALAAFRNAIINRLRTAGWTNIAAVLRHQHGSRGRSVHWSVARPMLTEPLTEEAEQRNIGTEYETVSLQVTITRFGCTRERATAAETETDLSDHIVALRRARGSRH